MRLLIAAALLALSGQSALAACTGRDLIAALPPERAAAIRAASEAVPYHEGLLFQAERGDQRITLIGTYHFPDPRHQATLDRVAPALAAADALFVEAAPADEERLAKALAADPTLMVDPDGPTLPERLEPAEWDALAQAMSDRGTPGVIAARMRPWYVALMLGVSPCMVRAMADGSGEQGLDRMLAQEAQAAGVPVRSLEPWDTIFGLFAGLSPEEELDMIRAGLPAAQYADDYAVTLTDAYFRGEVWSIWEFGRFDAYANSGLSRQAVDDQLSLVRTRLMDDRNRAWIAPLVQGAKRAGPDGIVAAFGALHLPGEAGVLSLLEDQGFTITRLDG